jgi:hypothetical protein
MKKRTPSFWRTLKLIVTNRFFVFFTLTALLALVAYGRNPTYLNTPNFYAEDGPVFAQTILDKGFLQALLTPFNGYFISGIYMLEGIAFTLNTMFWGGGILNQPAALAFTSYLFWGALCALPALLFWRDAQRKNWLIIICVALALLPLPSFGYAVLGTVGNYKFAFLFLAFLLLVKRHFLPAKSRAVYAIDALLAVCAFTNATTYLLLPFAALKYWPGSKGFSKKFFASLLKNSSFISLLALAAVAAAQLVFVVLHGGVDTLKGYLDQPFEFAKTIEIFVQRTFLFPFTHAFDGYLNDIIVLAFFAAGLGLLYKIARPQDRIILYFGLYAAFVGTALFVSQRTGVSQFFTNYTTSGTDHFFYAQNWIVLFTVLFIVAQAGGQARIRWQYAAMALLFITPLAMLMTNDFGQNTAAERTLGSLSRQAQVQCQVPGPEKLSLPVYPAGSGITMPINREVCTTPAVTQYVPERVPLNLMPANNNYIVVGSVKLTQTFVAEYNELAGISLYVSTFGDSNLNSYTFDLLDGDCRQVLRSHTFTTWSTPDNSYLDMRVKPIADSKGKRYCFAISPLSVSANQPVIAQQLSAPHIYKDGAAHKNDKELAEDIVFDVLYR